MNTLKSTTNSISNVQIEGLGLKYVLVVWIIISSGAIAILYNKFILTIIVNVLLIFILWLNKSRNIVSSFNQLTYIYIIFSSCIGHLFITILDGHIFYGGLLVLIILILCVFTCNYMSLTEFSKIYTNIIFVIACISLVGYLLQNKLILYSPQLPKLINGDNIYINLFLHIINIAIPHRNCGIFWEPGAFQVFLNIALVFSLFGSEDKYKLLKVIILTITIITTISTNGYIALGLIYFGYIISRGMKKKLKIILLMSISIFIMMSYSLDIVIKSLDYKFGLSTGMLSPNVTSRVNPFILDLMIMKEYLLGIPGVDYYADILREFSIKYNLPYVSSSCTHTVIGASLGVPFMVVALVGLYKFCSKIGNNKFSKLFVFLAITLIFSGESFLIYPLYYLIFLYGIISNQKRHFRGEGKL